MKMEHLFQHSPLKSTTLVGKIQPLLSFFILSTEEVHGVIKHVSSSIQLIDVIVLLSLGWLLVPTIGVVYNLLYPYVKEKKKNMMKKIGTFDDDTVDSEDDERTPYQRSYLFLVVNAMSQLAMLSLLVYACDCFLIAFQMMELGFTADQWLKISNVFAKIVYTSWAASRIKNLKSHFIRKALNRAPKNCDKIKFINNIMDAIILAMLFIKILQYLAVDTDYAVTSLFAVGTTGGLIISLASQEIAKGIMSGVEMAASNRFYVGDHVHFGDGTKGYIGKMGFLRTKIRLYDESVIDIANSQLSGQRVTNMSRVGHSRILTTLRFKYEDIQQLPDVLSQIKKEIVTSCPKLISEGKPFRANISSFERDHVEATIDCRFGLPPFGDEFWNARQDMFLAIDRAVCSRGLLYAKPGYFLKDD